MNRSISILFLCTFIFGAEYGKIAGRVIDSKTNDPLISANVIVEGTDLGAASDESGDYVVLYVPAGTYKMSASYISYDPLTYTDVIVNADQTTILNFHLQPTVIQMEGVTAIAERPLITISKTSTDRAITSQEMKRLPITTMDQVITLQAGVVQSDLGTHIRGGRGDEINYFVDGIVTKIPHTGRQSTHISPSSVEEVTIISGGFDAEYGDALSGIINIVTKQGDIKHAGSIHYLTDEIFLGVDALSYGYNCYNLSLGGPILSQLRYFLSGELMFTDAFEEAHYKVPSPRMDYRAQAKLSYLFLNAKGRVTVTGFKERRQMIFWAPSSSGPNGYKYFDNQPMSRTKNWIASVTIDYMLTPKTLTSLKIGATHFERARGTRDYQWEDDNNRKWYDDYRLKAEHLIDYLLEGELSVSAILTDSLGQHHERATNRGVDALRRNPYGIEGIFNTYGDVNFWYYWHNNDYQTRVSVTHSIGKVHEFKTGLDFIQYNIMHYHNYNIPYNYWDYYNRNPYKIAYYFQDKMDFEGIIARLGFRFDYFEPKAFTFVEPANLFNDSIIHAGASYKISPRLGFSLPVTDRMKFRFNYGHYYQFPGFDEMYQGTDTSNIRIQLISGGTTVGNILLKPQKTVMYEIGFENQLAEIIAFGFTAYSKDIYDLLQDREIPALPSSYYQFFNVDYGNVKGFEFNIKRKMAGMWALGISYTLQFARGSGSWASEWSDDRYFYNITLPVIDYWLDFDERHTVNANFDLELPADFNFILLQNFVNSFVVSYHSGHPYTPEDLDGNKIGDENSARMPGYWNVDWSFRRCIRIGSINFILNGIINNLFNTEQIKYVYRTTGRPDKHSDPEPNLGQFGYTTITSPYYSPQADYNHDGLVTPTEEKQAYMQAIADLYENPMHYKNPFRIRLGIGIEF